MHEFSIARSVLEIVLKHAGGRTVERVEVRVGHLRQVVPDTLRFAFELTARDSAAAGAELVLHEVPVEGRCTECAEVSRADDFPLRCPACGGLDLEILHGEELLVQSIEVSDEDP